MEGISSMSEAAASVRRMAEKEDAPAVSPFAYAIHPFSGLHIPVWTSEYVLAGIR